MKKMLYVHCKHVFIFLFLYIFLQLKLFFSLFFPLFNVFISNKVCAGPCTEHDGEWLCSYAEWKLEGSEVITS